MTPQATSMSTPAAPPAIDRPTAADGTLPAGYVGSSVLRLEDSRLVSGHGQYVDDLSLPNLAYAEIVRSPLAHARVRSVDTSAARQVPGVIAVLIAADVMPHLHAMMPVIEAGVPNRLQTPPHFPIAADEVCYEGEPVAVVIASTRYAASDGALAVVVDLEELPAVGDLDAAVRPESPAAHVDAVDNIAWDIHYPADGDVDAAFSTAAAVVRERIVQQRVCAASIECRVVVADYRDELTVWHASQMPHFNRHYVAEGLGLPESKVRFISPDVGGAFGAKMGPYAEDYLIPVASKLVARPVKWTETRSENLASTSHGRGQVFDVEAAADADGKLLALRVEQLVDVGAYFGRTGANPVVSVHLSGGCYEWPLIEGHTRGVITNRMWTGPYRGAGRPEATHLVERVMDLLAAELRLDPTDLRRRNFITHFPYHNQFGYTYDSGDYEATMDRALELAGYSDLRAQQLEARRRGRYLGIGIGSYVEISGFGPTSATAANDGEIGLTESAVVRVHPDAGVNVFAGTHSHGQGHATAYAQIVADDLGLPIDNVSVREGDTANTPFGHGTYGSRSIPVGGSAIHNACLKIVEKGRLLAAHRLGVAPSSLEFKDGAYSGDGVSMTIQEVAFAAYNRNLPDGMDQGLEETAYFDPPNFTWPFGTHLCVVEVDPSTGATEIQRYIAVDDCGNIINPMIVEGQIHGGVLQGVAQALLEEVTYDGATGQRAGGTFLDYLVPTINEMVPTEVYHTVTPTPSNSMGVKGVGEAGTIASSVAVINAICDALAPFGVKHIDMPASPMRVWKLLNTQSSAA